MKLSKEQFIEQYIYYKKKMDKANKEDDFKTNNKYALKVNDIIKVYENESYFAEAMNELMDNENYTIASNAASDSLRHNCNIEKAVITLEKISNKEDAGIIGFSAGIALKTWKEKGADGIK